VSDLDLTEAVQAAAQALAAERYPQRDWESIPVVVRFNLAEAVTPIVAAAAPVIEAATLEAAASDLYGDQPLSTATWLRLRASKASLDGHP